MQAISATAEEPLAIEGGLPQSRLLIPSLAAALAGTAKGPGGRPPFEWQMDAQGSDYPTLLLKSYN